MKKLILALALATPLVVNASIVTIEWDIEIDQIQDLITGHNNLLDSIKATGSVTFDNTISSITTQSFGIHTNFGEPTNRTVETSLASLIPDNPFVENGVRTFSNVSVLVHDYSVWFLEDWLIQFLDISTNNEAKPTTWNHHTSFGFTDLSAARSGTGASAYAADPVTNLAFYREAQRSGRAAGFSEGYQLFDSGLGNIIEERFWIGTAAISKITVHGVPTPTTLVLLTIGLLGITLTTRKTGRPLAKGGCPLKRGHQQSVTSFQ